MPSAYTNVPKPTGATYSIVTPSGKNQYDQSDIEYDDADVFYDGVDENAYTSIPKAYSGNLSWQWAIMIWENANFTWDDNSYTNIAKPT